MPVTYQTGFRTLNVLYTTTSGGTVFSANRNGTAAFDYFSDSAVVNDAIYFGCAYDASKIDFNIGTALAGTDVVIKWEYYQRDLSSVGGTGAGWYEIPSQQDDTVGFTVTGAQSFKFGIPYGWSRETVNSANYLWIRARIHSLTAITEGGANATVTVKLRDAAVNITSYTDETPCTLDEVRNHLLTNAPWLNVPKNFSDLNLHASFDMREVMLNVSSRLLCNREELVLGFYGRLPGYGGRAWLDYLQFGTPLGEGFGLEGGIFRMYTPGNITTASWTTTTETKFYNTLIDGTFASGYMEWKAQADFCMFKNCSFSPSQTGSMRNCLISTHSFVEYQNFFDVFENNKVIVNYNTAVGSIQGNFLGLTGNPGNCTIKNLDYEFESPSTGVLIRHWILRPPSTRFYDFINPIKPLPSNIGDYPHTFGTTNTGYGEPIGKVFFWNSVTDTYTDITTQAASTTTGDVPVHGNVGDMLYIGSSADTQIMKFAVFYTSLASNDWEYRWECFGNGQWREVDSTTHNTTDNFTSTLNTTTGKGHIWLYLNDSFPAFSSTTVNGSTYGIWFRMIITKAGTGTPYIDRIGLGAQRGTGKWNGYEKYTLDVKVTNEYNTALEGATVIIKRDGSVLATKTTDSDGDIAEQTIANRRWWFNPVDNWRINDHCSEETYSDIEIIVQKSGYQPYRAFVSMSKKQELTIALQPILSNNQHKSVISSQ
jgi:hypothetical protein